MTAFRHTTGYTAPDPEAVPLDLGGPGPQVYRPRWLGRPWRPADFRLPGSYSAPAGDAADLALRELIGEYTPPIVAQPTPDPADFGMAAGHVAPDADAVAFGLVATGDTGGDTGPDLGTRIGLNVSTGSRWARPSARYNQQRGIAYGAYRQPDPRVRVPSTAATPRHRQSRQPWGETTPRDRRGRPAWSTTIPATGATARVPWVELNARDRQGRPPWGPLTPADDRPDRLAWLHPPKIDVRDRTHYDHVDTAGPLRNTRPDTTVTYELDREALTDFTWALQSGYAAPDPLAVSLALETGYKEPITAVPPTPEHYEYRGLDEADFDMRGDYSAPAGSDADFAISDFYWPPTYDPPYDQEPIDLPNVRIQPRDWHGGTGWTGRIPTADAEDRTPWGPRGSRDTTGIDIEYPQEPPEPPPEPPPLPPEKRVYLLMPSIECKRVSDDLPIVVNAASVRTDRESWCWECDLTLARREDRDAIKPASSGPVEIQLTINGRSWRFLIERHRRTHSFKSGNSYSATGRSPSAELAAPYSTPRTFTTTQDRTANQAADDELENSGWSIVWNTTDWLIPAGGFSYQDLTPMQAIKRLAEAVGAVVVTDRTQKTLRVEPRYDVSPWERDEGVADKALTEDVIFQLDGEWKPGPGYNAVYVAGRQGGVIVHVVRANTAQDTEAEMTVDDLIVERLAGRERGRQILAGAGDRERVPIKTPLLPDPEAPGLVLPGMLLEVNEEGETWRGQVESCEVSATRQNATTVRQQIEVDRYYG